VDAARLLREARREACLSQAALARRARTSQQTVADYERGRKQPRSATLERLLRACGFELSLTAIDFGPRRRLLDAHRATILRIAHNHGARNVRVFGSVARGDDTDHSDLDLLVDLEAESTLLALAGLTEALSDELGTRVDVATPDLLRADIRERAAHEAVPL
jgi:hypothetical protein